METISFTHDPSTALEKRAKILAEALQTCVADVEITLHEQPAPTEMKMFGRRYDLPVDGGSVSDRIVANAQRLHSVSNMVLDKARGEYNQELMAAKLEGFVEAGELLMGKYAELLEVNPEAATKVLNMILEIVKTAQGESGKVSPEATNDGKYLIAA